MEALEHEAHLACPHRGTRILVQREEVGAGDDDGAAAGHVQPRQDRQQGALARAGRADDGHRFPFGQVEVDVMENGQHTSGVSHLLVEALNRDDGRWHS